MGREVILTICAHNDDQIIGAGGTLAKYGREGARIRTIICSFGESSHPHLRREVIVERRVKESLRSDKILCGSGVAYFGLKEGRFLEEFQQKKIKEKVRWIVRHEKPTKIFTHSLDDPHPDHRAVNKLVRELLKEGAIQCDTYEFTVWNVIKFLRRNVPRLVVDITGTFSTKIRALSAHKSQQVTMWSLLWNIYLKSRVLGFTHGYKFAEVFYKLN